MRSHSLNIIATFEYYYRLILKLFSFTSFILKFKIMNTFFAGVIGGAALGYGASRMMGHGFGGPFGWGLGHHGSWSSLSSFGSVGSFGSFD